MTIEIDINTDVISLSQTDDKHKSIEIDKKLFGNIYGKYFKKVAILALFQR